MRLVSFGMDMKNYTVDERVRGEGERIHDALQNLLDNMEIRCEQIRLELLKLRGERL